MNGAPKRLNKKVTFEVPSDLILYGSLIFASIILLLSIFFGLFTGGV